MNQRRPATTAAEDQLDAAITDLEVYLNGLDLPELVAELRCATGRLTNRLASQYGPGSHEAQTINAISTALARFDLDGATYYGVTGDGVTPDESAAKTSETWRALPCAVDLPEVDGCNADHGGLWGRVNKIHDLVHALMHTVIPRQD